MRQREWQLIDDEEQHLRRTGVDRPDGSCQERRERHSDDDLDDDVVRHDGWWFERRRRIEQLQRRLQRLGQLERRRVERHEPVARLIRPIQRRRLPAHRHTSPRHGRIWSFGLGRRGVIGLVRGHRLGRRIGIRFGFWGRQPDRRQRFGWDDKDELRDRNGRRQRRRRALAPTA